MTQRPSTDQHQRDPASVLMSIRAAYSAGILDGSKWFEFRRRELPAGVGTVVIARTGLGPAMLTGSFTVGGQRQFRVAEGWSRDQGANKTPPGWGINAGALADYAGGWDAPLWSITVSNPQQFTRPLPLSLLGFDRAPQSWRYLPDGWREMLA